MNEEKIREVFKDPAIIVEVIPEMRESDFPGMLIDLNDYSDETVEKMLNNNCVIRQDVQDLED